MTKKTAIVVICFFLIFLFSINQLEAQCAMCKQAAATNLETDPNSMAKNLNTGILYLMAVPYILIAFIFRKQLVSLWKSWRGKETATEPID